MRELPLLQDSSRVGMRPVKERRGFDLNINLPSFFINSGANNRVSINNSCLIMLICMEIDG